MQFSEGHSRIFLLKGGWWPSRTQIPNQTWLLPTNAVRSLAMQNGTRKAQFNFSVAACETSKQQAKYGFCTLLKGFFFI
jgi:hypothetical protein